MRPKRRILLIDPVADRQAVTRFVLEQTGFFVLSAPSVWEASEVARNDDPGPDALVGYPPIDPQYLEDLGYDLHVAHYMVPQAASMADIIARIRIATARKRGPKKATPIHPTQITQPAPAEACA